MPELLEIEMYRRHALGVVGQRIEAFELPDPDYLRNADVAGASAMLQGSEILALRRTGKVLFVDTGAATLALRFGMTGRLLLDSDSAIRELEYASNRDDPAWIRFRLRLSAATLEIIDPRRLGWVELDMDESVLGVDAWSLDSDTLAAALDSSVAVKTRLMDQRRIAGLGNLLTDDILWRAGIDPHTPARDLRRRQLAALEPAIHASLGELFERGGSHTGALQPERHADGRCPNDGAELRRSTIGGRTAYWCPAHQK